MKNRTQKVLYKGHYNKDYLSLSLSSLGYCLIQKAMNFSIAPSQTIEESLQKLLSLKALLKGGM